MTNHRYIRGKKVDHNNKNDAKILINEIKYNIRMNRLDTALSLIEDCLYYNPNNNYVLGYKAMVLDKMGKKEEAISIYENILKINDLSKRDKMFIMSQYANLLSKSNKELAAYYYEKVIKESKNVELVARSKLSILYTELKRYDDALNILRIDGFNNMFLNIKRANIYNTQDDYNNVLKALNEEEYNINNADVLENLDDEYIEQEKNFLYGHTFYKQGKFNLALSYLTKATNNRKRTIYFKTIIDMARIYILKGKIDDAITLCEELKKDTLSDFYNRIIDEVMAKAYTRKNDYEKAQEHYNNIETNEKIKNLNLGKIELLKGNFKKAEEYFSDLDVQLDDINVFYEEFYRLALIKFRLNKYDEVEEILDIFDSNLEKFEIYRMKYELDRIKLYINLVNSKEINNEKMSYSEKQIISYNEKEAIKHIIDHHIKNAKTSRFNENIDVEQLIIDVKDKLIKDNIIYDSLFDKYIIKYRDIGYSMNNETIHQLMILTLPNTKDIITMYPYDGTESIFTLEELEEKEKPKVKRLSQIEKFNMKYGNN
ncbi:MAG: hypothetical protein IJ105_03410 [Bacilli bacterium]|nr:hypothetical protein [Bacilli bacterium]